MWVREGTRKARNRHLAAQFGMAFEERFVGLEPADDVLARLRAVDPDDGLLAEQRLEALLVLRRAGRGCDLADLVDLDGDGVGAGVGRASVERNGALLVVDLSVVEEGVATA